MDLNTMLDAVVDNDRNGIHLGFTSNWGFKNYSTVSRDVRQVTTLLIERGVRKGAVVGILSPNSYEWMIFDLALIRLGSISVCFPMESFEGTALDEVKRVYNLNYLLLDAKSKIDVMPPWCGKLSLSSLTGEVDTNTTPSVIPDGVFTVVFSSGTSGVLKSLAISKKGIEDVISGFGRHYSFTEDDSILSFLPLSIFQQRWMLYAAIYFKFDFVIVDHLRLFKALSLKQPTIIGAPPLFYETIENRFRNLSAPVRYLLEASSVAIYHVSFGHVREQLLKRLFSPFYKALGGRFKLMLIGAAPPRASTLNFFRMAGLPLYEGYGLTETGYLTLNLPGSNKPGTVGKPIANDCIEISDDGEIIAHLSNPLCVGYLHEDSDEDSRKTFIDGKRIATGDIGTIDSDGYLTIKGRKKQIIITSGGVKIHPEQLEKKIESSSDDILRAVVLAGSGVNGLALVVSHRETMPESQNGIIDTAVKSVNHDLPLSARINSITLTQVQFNIQNGFMNRAMKIDREKVFESFVKRDVA